jgi:hypothetical protein
MRDDEESLGSLFSGRFFGRKLGCRTTVKSPQPPFTKGGFMAGPLQKGGAFGKVLREKEAFYSPPKPITSLTF